MSIYVMSRVWVASESTGSNRLILLAIADFANDEGDAFPSVKTLAKKSRMSERTAQYAIQSLIKSGELRVDKGIGPHGCNLYHVSLGTSPRGAESAGVQNHVSGGCKVEQGGVQDTTEGGAERCTQTVREPSIEPPLEPPTIAREPVKTKDALAEAIYQAYPKHKARIPALIAIRKAMLLHPADDLLAKATAYASAVSRWPIDERCFVPHCATWFNSGCYDDDQSTWERISKPKTNAFDNRPNSRSYAQTDDYSSITNK